MKITQASVLGLLGSVYAVTPSVRRPNMEMSSTAGTLKNKWPLFTVITVPTQPTGTPGATNVKKSVAAAIMPTGSTPAVDAEANTSLILQKAYYGETGYGCFRQNQYFSPVQYITAGSIGGIATTGGATGGTYTADAVAAQADTGVTTFWQFDQSKMGTNFSNELKPIHVYKTLASSNSWTLFATDSANVGLVTAAKGGNSSFLYGTNQANASSWACCNSVSNQMSCNGVIDTQLMVLDVNAVGGTSKLIQDRLVFKASAGLANDNANAALTRDNAKFGNSNVCPLDTAATDISIKTTSPYTAVEYDISKYNTDLLLASMPQSSLTTAFTAASGAHATARTALTGAATSYCDYQFYALTAAITPDQVFETRNGFNGSTKCTYQIQMGHTAAAPSFKVTEGGYRNFLIHWMEWLSDADLTAAALMTVLDASSFKLGTYATSGFKTLQPLNGGQDVSTASNYPTIGWDVAVKVWDFKDPAEYYPGSPGNVVYLPNKTGALSQESNVKFDAGLLMAMTNQITTGVNAFNTAKTTYEGLKTTYNKALKDEKARDAAATPDPIVIPVRPCPPSVVAPYSGPTLTTSDGSSVALTAIEVFEKARGYQQMKRTLTSVTVKNTVLGKAFPYFKIQAAGITNGDFTSTPTTAHQNRMGFLQGFDDVSTLVTTAKMAGHVFGRLGQSDEADAMKAFRWNKATAVTADKAVLQVSFFPETLTDTGLNTNALKIKFTASQKTWGAYSEFNAPTIPGAPTAPDAVSAVYLAATSTAAVALALATLY